VDELRAYYTEGSRKKKTNIVYYIQYIWDIYMGSRKVVPRKLHVRQQVDTDIKSRLWGSVGEAEGGVISESNTETHTLAYVK